MLTYRSGHTATLLVAGGVLGGFSQTAGLGAGTFGPTGPTPVLMTWYTATLFLDGSVLATGMGRQNAGLFIGDFFVFFPTTEVK